MWRCGRAEEKKEEARSTARDRADGAAAEGGAAVAESTRLSKSCRYRESGAGVDVSGDEASPEVFPVCIMGGEVGEKGSDPSYFYHSLLESYCSDAGVAAAGIVHQTKLAIQCGHRIPGS